MKAEKKIVTEEMLQEIVRRIMAAIQPEKIILFGAAARGEMGPDSDVDLLVIKACGHRRRTATKVERSLIGIGTPTDIIVATPDDIDRYKDTDRAYLSPGPEGREYDLFRIRKLLRDGSGVDLDMKVQKAFLAVPTARRVYPCWQKCRVR